jgi:hypothetical protein
MSALTSAAPRQRESLLLRSVRAAVLADFETELEVIAAGVIAASESGARLLRIR